MEYRQDHNSNFMRGGVDSAPASPTTASYSSVTESLGNSITNFGSWLSTTTAMTSPLTPTNDTKKKMSVSLMSKLKQQKLDTPGIWDRNENLRFRLDDESEIGCYYDGHNHKWYSWGRKPI